jgi:hypothetical protein
MKRRDGLLVRFRKSKSKSAHNTIDGVWTDGVIKDVSGAEATRLIESWPDNFSAVAEKAKKPAKDKKIGGKRNK